MKSPLSISHRDVGCAERSEKDRLLVSMCAGDYFMLSWQKVSLSRSGLSQDNVLRCWGRNDLSAEDNAANQSNELWNDWGNKMRRKSSKREGKKYLREKSAKWLMYGHWHEQQYRTFSTVYRLIVTGTTDCAIFFPTICSICQLIWSLTCCKVNMHYLPTRSTPVPTKMPVIIGALPIKTSAMTPGQLCRKTEQTEHLVQYSWVKEVKQWWQDHCKQLHLLAPTYIHLDVFKKPIWFWAGLLNELYYGDAS